MTDNESDVTPAPEEQQAAWRCTGACGGLIYNRDGDGRPVAGAPGAHFIDETRPRVCATCYELYWILQSSPYFRKLQEKPAADSKKHLRPGGEYLGY